MLFVPLKLLLIVSEGLQKQKGGERGGEGGEGGLEGRDGYTSQCSVF